MFSKLKDELSDKEKIKHYIRYLIVGVITMLISVFSFKVIRIYLPDLNENFANILSIIIAIIFSYFMNRSFVFESKERNVVKEFSKFFSGRLVTLIIEETVFFSGTAIFQFNEMPVKVSSTIIAFVMNYIFSRWIVFRNSKINNKK